MNRTHVAYVIPALMLLVFAANEFVSFHDLYGIPFLLAGIGAVLVGRGWKGWALGAAFAAIAVYWSTNDPSGCSAWWRARYVTEKAFGFQPYLSWDDVQFAAFGRGHCYDYDTAQTQLTAPIELLAEDEVDGHPLQQFRTQLGDFWLAEEDGHESLTWLVWEIDVDEAYRGHADTILPGDIVVDAGAHVGVFTRWALKQGAERVIAIEPNPDNIICLERNFAEDITAGKVTIVKAGIWDEEGDLELKIHDHITSRSTLMGMSDVSHSITVPVRPLDAVLDELGVDRVDFIKMDIEGAERRALEGARKTIEHSRPRMALCTYHEKDDPVTVPETVLSVHADYRIHGKQIDVNMLDVRPKILFFN